MTFWAQFLPTGMHEEPKLITKFNNRKKVTISIPVKLSEYRKTNTFPIIEYMQNLTNSFPLGRIASTRKHITIKYEM